MIKKYLLRPFVLSFSILLICAGSFAQSNADDIAGNWINTPHETIAINVYKTDAGYAGKIIWTKDNDSSKPKGFLILEGLVFDPEKRIWDNGKIHSPGGKTYNATAKIKADGTLEVHGYAGMKFIGTRKLFKRTQIK